MKKYIMAAIAAVATMSLFTSCSEEESVKMNTKDGAPIRFSAITKAANGTRTSYSTTTHTTNGKEYWDLYWVSDDQVKIFCPEANTQGTNENVATYTVVSTDASAKVTKYALDGEGLHWGSKDEHHFYEAYPSKNVSEITATSVTATIPSTQKAKLQADGYYADMDAALMAGKTSCEKSKVETTGLDIPFEPIFTAVDITVSASDNIGFTLNSITVANSEKAIGTQQPLAGKFTYTFDAPVGSKFASVSTVDEDYNVQLEFETPIKLTRDTEVEGAVPEVKATVFLRGDFSNAVKVVLNGSGKTSVGNNLVQVKKQGAADDKLTALARNHVTLGKLPAEQFQPMTGEWWVSHTHNDAYVSQMSLPGVYDASGFVQDTKGSDRAQTYLFTNADNKYYEQMKAYLNAGNRAFDFKFEYDESFDGNWKTSRAKTLTGIFSEGSEPASLDKFVKAADEWLKVHTTEFLIFFVSDYNHASSNSGYKSHISQYLRSSLGNRLLESFSPDITVEEARGKILVVNASPADDPVGLTTSGWILNNRISYGSNGRTEDNEKNYNEYDLGKDGKIYVQDYNNAHNSNTSNQNKKATYLNEIINKAKGDTSAKHWYYVSNAYRHYAWLGDLTYSDATKNKFRPEMKTRVLAMSNNGTYEKTGIVLQAYAANNDNLQTGENTRLLEDIIWANNYKADGPLKAQGK